MPDVPIHVGGVVMLMPFDPEQIIACDGQDKHVVGHVGERRVNRSNAVVPAFIWDQAPSKDVPLFDHVCTECGAPITFPRARARSF